MPLLQTFGAASARAFGFTRGSAAGGNALELISTQMLGSNTATVTFSSIPQTYKHLQLRMLARSSFATTSDGMVMTFNGNTTANYAEHRIYANGVSLLSQNSSGANNTFFGYAPGSTATASVFATSIIDFLDYTNTTKNPVVRVMSALVNGTGNSVIMFGSNMLNVAAATTSFSITMPNNGGQFVAGSRFSLYGVKG